jgi:hypothetical protein
MQEHGLTLRIENMLFGLPLKLGHWSRRNTIQNSEVNNV